MNSYLLVALVVLPSCGGSINCRVACRECRDAREQKELLAIYCAMCDECKDRRREREWLISRKQDLDRETEDHQTVSKKRQMFRTHRSEIPECPTPPTCEEERPKCPPCPSPTYYPPPNVIPYGCPTAPPCEEETTTTTPRPTCPPIPQCVMKRPTLPDGYYQPVQQYQQPPMYHMPTQPEPAPLPTMPTMPTVHSCVPCVNMCPCPQGQGTESVFIGIPDQMLQ